MEKSWKFSKKYIWNNFEIISYVFFSKFPGFFQIMPKILNSNLELSIFGMISVPLEQFLSQATGRLQKVILFDQA